MKRLFTLLLISFAALSFEMIDEKLDDFIGRDDSSVTTIANNQILYTSTDGKIVEPYSDWINNYADALTTFGVNIVSNTYADGKGVIEFDGNVTTIGDSAFYNCSSLTSVTIPDSVTSIGYEAFAWCSSLTSVTIPDSVTSIGAAAFYVCSSLQEFRGKFASKDGRCLIIDGVLNSFAPAGLTEYTIPDSVTSIGDRAFYGCYSITSVTIPDGVTSIGDYVFSWCKSLTNVTIPDSVTTIGDEAFVYCSSLTSVTIGDSVTTIGKYAFRDCSSLTSVYCKAITPPSCRNYMFDKNADDRKIYVPMESVEAYKSASGWSEYASDIVGYNF